ncbi:hypothetical protein CBR_g4202 [Chara braunii]|uniref:Uncharacterized protein n=1 Tax=Chara braunii TaxID=69332 RepID=A0A388KHI9_CHABU|nr:hypothetical protein CBR_g4202 [Chara braunii]|eukprot:GBG69509.1 hypothetical protein CBR_g4202 [Chara braunii]
MDNYGTLSTFQNAKDKWNTPSHQIVVIQNIRKLWHESNCPEAKGGSATEVKNADYRKFAGEALRLTGIRNLVDMSLTTQWSGQWSDALGPYMLLARATDDVKLFEKVKQVYAAWEAGQLSGRDAVKPATKQGESGKASKAGPGFELKGGVRYPVQGTKGPGYLVAMHDPDIRAWKPFSALGRCERLQLLRDILTDNVILTPKQSGAAQCAGKYSTETYAEMVKIERAMLRMFHYFVFISDPQRKSSEWTERFFNNLSDLFDKYCDEGLRSERWIDQRRHFKDINWVRTFPATVGGEEEKGEAGFKKTASLAAKCPEELVQFVNKLLRRSETRGSETIRMSGTRKYIHFNKQNVNFVFIPFQWEPSDISDEMDSKEIYRVVKHLSCHTAVLDLCHPTQIGVWTEEVFDGLWKFMGKLAGDYWTLLYFVPRSCEYTFFKQVTSWDIDIHLSILKWTRQQQTKAKHSYKVANLPLEDTNKMVVIMYSNDGDHHRNTIPLLEDIPANTPAANRSSGEQAGDLSALVHKERRPKMLIDVVEKNFTPTKLKMAGMGPKEKFVYEGMEREPNAMVETFEHFCPADEVVVFLGKGHAALIWELLKSYRHCIVLEGEGMKFEFLVQFVNRMVKSGGYFAKFVKPPPQHDEKRDLVYKVGQNIVNIWEFIFETKSQNRGGRAYVTRRRKMESLLRGYHKAPAETEVAFLDRLEMMYFDEHIGAFTIAAYATCFGEGFDAEDSEEESDDGPLQAALADERQKACSSVSQKMGASGTSCGSGGASSIAVSTDQFQRTSFNGPVSTDQLHGGQHNNAIFRRSSG